jgi:hypothetical protein
VSRPAAALRSLLQGARTAALGTLDDEGAPFVSMVPFAVAPALGCLVLHVSALAAHSRHLRERPRVSLLVMQPEVPGEPVHALPRLTLQAEASVPSPGSAPWQACRAAYLDRFPEAAFMTELGDFAFVAAYPDRGRHIAGFGAARDVDRLELDAALGEGTLGDIEPVPDGR